MKKALIALAATASPTATLWLRFFCRGPLEKMWRFVTSGRPGHTAKAVAV